MRWSRRSSRRLSKLAGIVRVAAILFLLSACQPIQPEPSGVAVATGEAEEEPAAMGELTAHVSVSGFEIGLPEGWATADDAAGFMLVVSDPELLAAEDLLPIQDGAMMVFLNMSKADLPPLPLGDLVGMFVDSQALPVDETGEPEQSTIGGQPALLATGSGEADGVPFTYRSAGVETETRVGRVIAVLPQAREAELGPLVESVIHSMVVGEPTPAALDLSVIEGEITPGEPVNAALDPDTTMIWHLAGTEGQTLIVAATPSSELDIVVSLVDATGAPLFAVGEADSEGNGGAERRLATIPADGDYYVVARGFTGSGGDFEVAVTETSIAGNVESADDLVGTWGDLATLYRIDADGTLRVGIDEAMLESEPVYQGTYSVEDGLITIGRNEAGDFCADSDATYEGAFLTGGELVLSPVDDPCPRRAFGLNGNVLSPVQD